MQHVRAANASARNAPTARGGARAPMRQAALNFGGTGGIAKVLAPAAAGLTALSIPSYVEAAHTSMGDATIDGQHKAQRAPVVQEVAEYILNGNHISDEEIMLLIGEGAGVDPAAQAKGAWEVRDMVDRVRDAQLEQFNQSRRVATEGRKNDYPAGW